MGGCGFWNKFLYNPLKYEKHHLGASWNVNEKILSIVLRPKKKNRIDIGKFNYQKAKGNERL